MDQNEFNTYLDNLLVEAKLENEASEFTQKIHKIISDTTFNESKQSFLFISIDDISHPSPDAFISYVVNENSYPSLLQAIKNFTKRISNGINEN